MYCTGRIGGKSLFLRSGNTGLREAGVQHGYICPGTGILDGAGMITSARCGQLVKRTHCGKQQTWKRLDMKPDAAGASRMEHICQ